MTTKLDRNNLLAIGISPGNVEALYQLWDVAGRGEGLPVEDLREMVATHASQIFALDRDVEAMVEDVDSANAQAASLNSAVTTLASHVGALAAKVEVRRAGFVVISDTDTYQSVGLEPAEPDSTYIVVTTVNDTSGSPAAGSLRSRVGNKANGAFNIILEAAPGAGNSVTVGWILDRA